MNRPNTNELLNELLSPSPDYITHKNSIITNLVEISLLNRLEVRLFGNSLPVLRYIVAERIKPFVRLVKQYDMLVHDLGIKTLNYIELWSYYLPIVQYLILRRINMNSCFITGIIGGPGAGKTTFAKMLTLIMNTGYQLLAVDISSDDFYKSRSERLALGFKWRGLPETHENDLVKNAFGNLKDLRQIQRLPRYDLELDDRSRFESIYGPLCFCFFEGWMVARLIEDLFGSINNIIDFLIFMDTKIEFLKKSRLEKESKKREKSNNKYGLPESEMLMFWDEIIEPGINEYVLSYKRKADLILRIDDEYDLIDVRKTNDR